MNNTLALKDNGVNKNNATNKAKKQRKQRKKAYHNNKSITVTITSSTVTRTVTNLIATTRMNTTSFLTPPSSLIPTIVLPTIVQSSSINQSVNNDNNKIETVTHYDLDLSETTLNQDLHSPIENNNNNNLESKSISAAAIVGNDSSTHNNNNTSAKTINVVGPILGIFAGIAFMAAAMFLVVRNRNKRRLTTNELNNDNNDNNNNDDNVFHNISLEDEAIIIMPPLKDEKKRASFDSISDTLIGSNQSTKKQNSWQSAANSTLVNHHISSFLMVAERQQLQHEKPNILDHFNKLPIETYKAQLADILYEEEDFYQNPLPFISINDISDFYK